MKADPEFFDYVDDIEPFASSDYTVEDLPESSLERAVLLSFLTRHYAPLTPEDARDAGWVEASEEEVREALEKLTESDFLDKVSEKQYSLNKNSELVSVVQDSRVEYIVDNTY